MANIKSQKKRILTNEKRRVRNQSVKSELKTLVRQTREAVEAGDKEKALAALRVASRKLDVAVSKGVIHKNQAANRKSKLARRVASIADGSRTIVRREAGRPSGRPAFVYPLPHNQGAGTHDKAGLRVKMCVWLGVSRGLDLAFLNAD